MCIRDSLIGAGQISDVIDHGSDADDHFDTQFLGNGSGDLFGDFLQLSGVGPLRQLLNQGHILSLIHI